MYLNEYQVAAIRTASGPSVNSKTDMIIAGALGLAGEAGEFADRVKKWQYQGHDMDKAKMAEEIGDILWYCALAAEGLGMNLGIIAFENIKKLRSRYPDKFSTERSLNRD